MNRVEKALRHISKESCGVEIGPSYSPMAPKKQGYNVHIIDHINREDLLEKYKDSDVECNNIEEVDYIWQGESYTELTGVKKYYDWIIASHLIEHVPDLVGFLNNCDSILKDNGVISLVIPDKRYCFDHFRTLSGINQVVDAHLQKHKFHTVGTKLDFALNIVKKNENIAWDSNTTGKYVFHDSAEKAQEIVTDAIEQKAYSDAHCWCFVPHSFRLMIQDLSNLGLIALKEIDFYPTAGCEFFITLGRQGKGTNTSRLEMLKKIESEIVEDSSYHQSVRYTQNEALEDVLNSTCWKLTAPLRYLSEKLRGK